jgi:hypothetical protein
VTNSREDIAKNQVRDEMLMEIIKEVQEVKTVFMISKGKKWYEFW